ncbi:uncharacterized protein LOC129296481 [Prosopis cineraria]|uniref:uncharacterized protein LOC129296481 n=1 Tax=Prosopis cineraria TaxID=364024 RepID=UPI00240EB2EB|nr:uncharacterized protein LOC129296481 [Prosopis cineraria]
MARIEWGLQGRGKWVCSYKKTAIIVCFFNIAVALYFLRTLYASLYIYSGNVSRSIVPYTSDQIRKMEESIQIRKAYKPRNWLKWVKVLEGELSREERGSQLPQHLRQKIMDEILLTLRSLNSTATNTTRNLHGARMSTAILFFPARFICHGREGVKLFLLLVILLLNNTEAVESWREEKLKEAKLALVQSTSNSTVARKEAGMLVRALESDWLALSEEIGLWMPGVVANEEHDDKPEGEVDFEEEILPGRPMPPECHPELHTDYDGVAVRWGLTHHKDSAADCCQACLDQARNAKEGERKCNIWVYCPSEFGCHSPDIYQHKHQECWLKYAEKPRLNFKYKYPESYRNSHPSAPVIVPWASGVVGA